MSETRANTTALAAALSGPTFDGAASRSALHASERHVERWAPEGPSASRSRGLRSLAFADHVAAPWMSASTMMHPRSSAMYGSRHERSAPGVSWVFPRPWYQDELDWMAAARQGAEATPQFLTTRGTYASARTSAADVAMPVVAPELVVPSMMAGSMTARAASASQAPAMGFVAGMPAALPSSAAAMQHGLRAWSPSVPFAAAAAAEVVAGAVGAVASSGLASVAERSPLLAGLTMVSPAALSGHAAPRAGQAAAIDASSSTIARLEQARRPDPIAAELMSTVSAQVAAREASAGESAPSVGEAARSSSVSSASSLVDAPSASEVAMSATINASPAMAGALRAMELLIRAASPAPVAPSSAPASAPPATAPTYASAPSFAAAPSSNLSPIVGPRVSMPVGLGGLAAAIETAQTLASPFSRATQAPLARAAAAGLSMADAVTPPTAGAAAQAPGADARAAGAPPAEALSPAFRAIAPGWAPIWAQPMSALASVASERPRAVDHMAWSDRWLARFAGASPVALAAFDVSRGDAVAAPRLLAAQSPEVVYVHPELGPARLRAAVDATRQVQPISERPVVAPAPRPTAALRIDDSESTPDSVFAALLAPQAAPLAPPSRAAAAAAARAAQPAPERPAVSMVDAVRGGARPTAADLISISAPTAPDAGLSPSLASSPMAAAIAGVVPMPQAPVFDPRALYSSGMATAYLGGLTARAAAPVGVLASAPTAGALASVARFGDVAAAGGAMGGWALRDLALSPLALRISSIAQGAPERTMLATGGEVDVVVRGGGPLARARAAEAPSWTAAPAPTFRGADLEQVLLTQPSRPAAASTPSATGPAVAPPAVAASTPAATAGAPTEAAPSAPSFGPEAFPASMAASPAPLAAIEPELLALRSALLASPTAWSAPLAHSTSPLLLSSAMTVPGASVGAELPLVRPSAAGAEDASSVDAPAYQAQAAAARASMPLYTLPAIGGASPSALSTAIAGHAASGTFVPPAHAATGAAGELNETPAPIASGRPGALAEQALRWSVAEERNAAGLSFDFVSPEMVLAAKVYGLSPASAAEASRLAVAGPNALASLAMSLDLTFLRSFQQAGQQVGGEAPGARVGSAASFAAPASFASSVEPGAVGADAPAAAAQAAALAPAALASSAADLIAQPLASSTAPAAQPGGAPAVGPGLAPADAAALASMSMAGWDVSGPGAARGGEVPSWSAAPAAPARMPRGAFLWPNGSVNALGLRAQSTDGVAGLPVVALELLAAQAVADLGTWVTAFPQADHKVLASALRAAGLPVPAGAAGLPVPAGASPGVAAAGAAPDMTVLAGGQAPVGGELSARTAAAMASAAMAPAGSAGAFGPMGAMGPMGPMESTGPAGSMGPMGSMPADEAALSAEAASVTSTVDDESWTTVSTSASPAALRARFQSVYVALSRSPEGLSLSPSVRAARAMAVISSSEGTGLSPRARAAAVWSVMPQVFQGDLDLLAPVLAGESPVAGRGADAEGRTGMSAMASRAGQALGSFVAPHDAEIATAGGRAAQPPLAQRVDTPVYVDTARAEPERAQPTPAQTLGRPGRTFAQFGGGEPEIPAWFESAARKMLDDRGVGGGGGGMSLAELVLVTAMPQRSIAASTRSAAPGRPAAHGKSAEKGGDKKPDVAKLAHDVYNEVLKLIEAARERSGDPYQ